MTKPTAEMVALRLQVTKETFDWLRARAVDDASVEEEVAAMLEEEASSEIMREGGLIAITKFEARIALSKIYLLLQAMDNGFMLEHFLRTGVELVEACMLVGMTQEGGEDLAAWLEQAENLKSGRRV